MKKRAAGSPLSEAERQQRREAAKARWKRYAGNTAGAVMGGFGALSGAAIGGAAGFTAAAIADRGADGRSPLGRGTVGRKLAAFSLRRDKSFRESVKRAGAKARSGLRESAPAGPSDAKAEAARRKIMEEAANRGGDMKQAEIDARAAYDRVASRKRSARSGSPAAQVSERVRDAIAEARRGGGGIRLDLASGVAGDAGGFGLEQAAVRSAMRRRIAEGVFSNSFTSSISRMKARPLAAATLGGAAIAGAAGAHSSYHDTRDNFLPADEASRRRALVSAGVYLGATGSLLGAHQAARSGAKTRAGVAGAMATGAALGAGLGALNQSEGFKMRDRERAKAANKFDEAETGVMRKSDIGRMRWAGLSKGEIGGELRKEARRRIHERYGEIGRAGGGGAISGAVAHGTGAGFFMPPIGTALGAVMGAQHGANAHALRSKLGGSPKRTPKDLKGRFERNIGGLTNNTLLGTASTLGGAAAGAAIGARSGQAAGGAIAGAIAGRALTAPHTYSRGHRRVRDSQIWQRDFANKG
ncbi:hypothetical protein [Falsiroseomonas sp. CW058]|uniref:hypothetical protein n=1 Tax=Falsiroseomonas sp. CW058 TaxID=3388664 RepID=UPI003D320243